ncbi:NgoFVII family restriction endonuclease [Paraclostridium bifermentans]|uniref:NgoFVII family restriction endonuclease n=1 Tax=Paraclostridium bifermentans TaxID=1490 RepID=UPI00290D3723|nr:NgoFVII family restriction endonuclease [Paraclostridium bifermentans]MDU3338001.1 NgoFVII family restriction endonuclease [Paraclostridium bifermentans]
MADIIWNKFLDKEKKEYIEFLKIFGALSGLFKDNQQGANARKPYLYYRNHEQLFARVFDVEDLTRKDSAFDALANWKGNRVGIGLKTWIHTKDLTYQKVAEFNKLAPIEIEPIIKNGSPEEVIRKVSELRNDRIMLDKRLHGTDREVYHFITRDNDVMNIIETKYDLIDIDSLELIKSDGKTYAFRDKFHKYKFYKSKSVLLEEFDASQGEIIEKIPIEQYDDPFELIKMINIPKNTEEIINEEIYLPLYQDKKEGRVVSDCSGINIRHSKPKSKGSSTPRPEYEIEVRVSKWIHHVFPNFFGLNALDEDQVKNSELNDFDLILPDDRVLSGRIKQQNGKSLQTNPQGALGEWILKDILGLENREVVTWELLDRLGIDSLKITKLNDKKFKVTVAETGAYEKFKVDNEDKMISAGLTNRQIPYLRPELVQELEE